MSSIDHQYYALRGKSYLMMHEAHYNASFTFKMLKIARKIVL